MITYLIIDDEHIAHGIIKRYCDMMSTMQLMKNCYDALEAIEYLNTHTVDLIFLDLNMPKLKGFDFLKTLSSPPKVIVTTAYQEFALEGYELNIVDYLLKPFSFERFLKAITDVLATLPKKDFIQVHKSFAVAKNHIDTIEGNRIVIQGTIIPVGQTYKSNIHSLLQ